ncbi:type IV pilus biogenesis protein PilM [Marinisporobacter balticus]|uniref:Type IV pilus assembly protein PilM n=1 Tax=Marinisporobacter balticus TaxID=2018667 RepID=A0A4R2KZ31_9FIRM|nr:pilus assembly protein PilM [Marinisporobacter balticus]TCO79173.1 type IV pilus assembly protein PilM [Marinisporobacter balticus]
MFPKNTLSIDIDTHCIKIIVGKCKNNLVFIEDAVILSTPEGSFANGQIADIEKIINRIKPFLRNRNFWGKGVVFSFESRSIIEREVFLPYVKGKKIDKMIFYEIKEYFPMSLEKYIIQYKRIEDIYKGDEKVSRFLVSVLPKKIVENYLLLSKQLNLRPRCLDSHTGSIGNIFSKNIEINDKCIKNETIAIIDLGDENIYINIWEHGVYQFSKLIEILGKDIEKHDEWIDELMRVLDYYSSKKVVGEIDKIYLIGKYAHADKMKQYLKTTFHIPVCSIEKVSNVKINVKDHFDLSLYFSAIGAIIK